MRRFLRLASLALSLAAAANLSLIAAAEAQSHKGKSSRHAKTDSRKKPPVVKERGWSFAREDGLPTLKYVQTIGGRTVVSFACQNNASVRIVANINARGLHPGDSARLRLSTGLHRIELAATAFSGEQKGPPLIGGTTRLEPRFLQLFNNGDAMIIEVPGRNTGVPLKGVETKIDAFEKACRGGR
jgi:hypothetical protein